MKNRKKSIPLQMQYVPIDKLKLWEKNPRKNEEAAQRLSKLIAEYGFINPIIASTDGTIRAGHTRIKAAISLGMKTVPVIFVNFKNEKNAIGFSLADNKSMEFASWNNVLLTEVMHHLKDVDFQMDLTGFDELEIDSFFEDKSNGADKFDANKEAAKIKNPKTKTGDIIQLGRHRIMCGDTRRLEDVRELMNGQAASMIFTDPPYNVQLKHRGKRHEKIKNYEDNLHEDDYANLLYAMMNRIEENLRPGRAFYIFIGWNVMNICLNVINTYPTMLYHQMLIWDKEWPVLGETDYLKGYEHLIYGWKKGGKRKFNPKTGGDVDVWRIKKDNPAEYLHIAQRPIAVPERAIKNSSDKDDIILDLFLGSGSTLIACEKTNRICYGMEIDPVYVDVIIERFNQFKKSEETIS